MPKTVADLKSACATALKQTFGHTAFRRNQEQAILSALQGQDVFVLMPTGGGKSMCFVVPALVGKGLVVVVSPLIALMQDQVSNLTAKGIPCDYLSSTKTQGERDAVLDCLKSSPNRLKLLYVTPELIDTDRFKRLLKGLQQRGALLLFAIDEAHCISSWGHDFRPAYCKLRSLRDQMPSVPIMALTATAAPAVQEDIVKQLRLSKPKVLVSSFNRPNITYTVLYPDLDQDSNGQPNGADDHDSMKATAVYGCIKKLMDQSKGGEVPCGVIYTLKRTDTEDIARWLTSRGVHTAAYHASLSKEQRTKVLEDWQQGKVPLVAATVAFGMGIDKADVRIVVHADLPKTVEGFYQESGRAGRDGLPSQSVLLYTHADMCRLRAVLSKGKGADKKRKRDDTSAGSNSELSSFNQVVQYCTTASCRRTMLLEHFGETAGPKLCNGTCDFCANSVAVGQNIQCLKDLEASISRSGWFGGRAGAGRPGKRDPGGGLMKYDPAWVEDEDEDEDGAGGSDEEQEDPQVAEARALATKVKSKAGKNESAFLAAMMKAEAQQSSKSKAGGGVLGRLEAKQTKADPDGAASKPSGIQEAVRNKAREEITKKLRANTALRHADELVEKMASACEKRMFVSSQGSMPSYRTALGAAVRAAAGAKFVLEAPGGKELLGSCSEADQGTLLLAQVTCVEQQHLKDSGTNSASLCITALQSLQQVQVTFSLLKTSGVHKRVAALQQGAPEAVGQAAAAVVDTWKQALKAKCAKS